MKMGGCGEGGRGDALRGAIAQQWGDMKSAGGGGGGAPPGRPTTNQPNKKKGQRLSRNQ